MLHYNKPLKTAVFVLASVLSVFLFASEGSIGRISQASSTLSLSIPDVTQLRGLSSEWQQASQNMAAPFCLHGGENYTLSSEDPRVTVRFQKDNMTMKPSQLHCATDAHGVLELDSGGTALHGVIMVIVAAE